MTLVAWAYPETYTDAGRIITKGGNSGFRGFSLNVENVTGGLWRMQIPVNATTLVSCSTANGTVATNTWTHIAGVYDGVNIKLDKAGGILQGYRMIQIARALGLKTMLGCMISSSLSVTAAAQLSPLVDYADLDGNLLIGHDPYIGATVRARWWRACMSKGTFHCR